MNEIQYRIFIYIDVVCTCVILQDIKEMASIALMLMR